MTVWRRAVVAMACTAAVAAVTGPTAAVAQVAEGTGSYYVTFVARTCPDDPTNTIYENIFANTARNNIMESLQDLGPDSPYDPFVEVLPTVEDDPPQDVCTPIEGWTFTLGSAYQTPGVDGLSIVTGADGTATTPTTTTPLLDSDGQWTGESLAGAVTVELTADQVTRASTGNLWVQGGTTTEPLNEDQSQFVDRFGFGALRCAKDNVNGDNVEFVSFPVGKTHVFCYAFYVEPPPDAATIVARSEIAGSPAVTQAFQFGGNVSYEPGGLFDLTVNNGVPGEQTFARGATLVPGGEPWRLVQQKASGYVITSVDCVSSNSTSQIVVEEVLFTSASGVFALGAGDTVTCTFVNTPEDQISTLRLRKQTLGTGGGPFTLRVTQGGATVGDPLPVSTSRAGESIIAGDVDLPPGEYELVESVEQANRPGVEWSQTSIECNGQVLAPGPGGGGLLTVGAQQQYDCTFTNTGVEKGSITIIKTTEVGTGTFRYVISPVGVGRLAVQAPFRQQVTTPGPGVPATATGDLLENLALGRYQIAEIGPPESTLGEWRLVNASCTTGLARGRPNVGLEVTLTADAPSAVCTFTNRFNPLPPPVRLASKFVALTPVRILDTRTQNGQVGYSGPKPGPGTVVDFQVTGRGGVPSSDVTAVVMNVTATEPVGEGYVTAWPSGEVQPHVSNLNARPEPLAPQGEQAVPNLVTVPVGVGGRVSIFTQSGTDLLADVAGYYQEVALSAEGRLMPLPEPVRVLDTRPASGPLGYTGDKPAADSTVTFKVAGVGGVPATGAASVVLNVTATEATGRGFITAFPGGHPVRPWASSLNLEYLDQTVANQVVVPLGANGEVSLYTQSGAHLVADVAGWFTDATAPVDVRGLFRAISPERHLDTRSGAGPVPAGGTITVPAGSTVTGDSLIPDDLVGAVIANVTATEALDRGFVTAYPTGSLLPWASNLNVERPGQTLPNHVTVRVGTGGGFDLYTQSGTHLVADLFGWYVG